MANILYGPLATEIAGHIGNVVFQRNPTGKIARVRRLPRLQRTPLQLYQRSIITEAAQRWSRTLTPAMRIDWRTYALTCPFINSLGVTYYLSGFGIYCRNFTILYPYNDYADTRPSLDGFPLEILPTMSLDRTTGALTIESVDPAMEAGERLLFNIYDVQWTHLKYLPPRHLSNDYIQDDYPIPYQLYLYGGPLGSVAGDMGCWLADYSHDSIGRVGKLRLQWIPTS